jgi:hypothetical protein
MVLFVSSSAACECHKLHFSFDCMQGTTEISQMELEAEEVEPFYSFGCADFF